MTLKQMILTALATNDAQLACRVADLLRNGALRLKDGTRVLYNYNDMLAQVARVTGRDVADVGPEWENLLAEGDNGAAEDARDDARNRVLS